MEQPKPDTKNWTWVLERTCDECGFSGAGMDPSSVAAQIRSNAAAWRAVLKNSKVAERPPSKGTDGPIWSALEYGAHVRDVYEVYVDRVLRMMKKDNPEFPDWNQDATAIEKDYANEDPDKVSYALAVNAGKMADLFDKVRDWNRPGVRTDGSAFTIGTIAVYLLHDPVHHLHDVERGFEAIKEANS